MDLRTDEATLADVLRSYRSDRRLSQEELAERAGVSTRTVSDIECGVAKSPRAITLSLLAEALGLDASGRDRLRTAARRPVAALTVIERRTADLQNLPLAVTSFIGREDELTAIATLLDEHRVVTVAGPGGMGKTRATLAVAASVRDRFPDGIWFAGLAPFTDAARVPGVIAGALGIRLPEQGDALAALVAQVGSKTLLVVLDNCEHLVTSAANAVTALQRGCANVRILASSRQKLGVAGEAVYRIPPMRLPTAEVAARLAPDEALAYEAIALFVARARAADGRYVLAAADVAVVAHVCRRVDGMPLAIELAAGRADILGPRDLATRLDRRFDMLRAPRDVDARQQTLRALLDWSYDLLDDGERAVFRRIGVFVDGFTFDAADAVAGGDGMAEHDIFELLASLVDKSLVVAEIEERRTRFRLLETTRDYALAQLDACGERSRIAGAHLTYFCHAAERTYATFLATGSDAAFMTTLASELQNVRAALAWSFAGGDLVAGASLAASIGHPLSRLGLSEEGIERLEACAHRLGDAGGPLLHARLWNAIAWLAFNTLRGTLAEEGARRAVSYARLAGDAETLAIALGYAAIAAARTGNVADAAARLDEAERLTVAPTPAQRLRDVELRGFVAQAGGDLDAAATAYETHRTLRRKLGDEFGEASATLTLAEIEHASGRTERAIALTRDVLPNASRLLGREQHANALSNLAAYLLASNDVAGARETVDRAIALLSDGDLDSPLLAFALEHAAFALLLGGSLERAARLHGYCDAAVERLGVHREYTERQTHERLASVLRHRLGPALEALEREGAGTSAHAALELAKM